MRVCKKIGIGVSIVCLLFGVYASSVLAISSSQWKELFGPKEEYIEGPIFGPEAKGLKGKVSIWLCSYAPRERRATDRWTPAQYAWTLEKEYEKIHPEVDLDIWESGALPGWAQMSEYRTWLEAQVVGGTAPEIVWMQHPWGRESYGPRGTLTDFRPFLNMPNPYVKDNQKWIDEWESIFDVEKGPHGERWVIVGAMVTTGMFYNKDIFAKVGVLPPDTWAELMDLCSKLKAAGSPMILAGGLITPGSFEWTERIIYFQLYADEVFGVMDVDKNGMVDLKERVIAFKKRIIDPMSPKYQAYWKLMKEWSQYWIPGFLSITTDGKAYELFIAEKGGIYWGGSWSIKPLLYDQARKFDFGVFRFPEITRDSSPFVAEKNPGGLMGGLGCAYRYSVPKVVKERGLLRETVDFLMFLTAPQNTGPYCADEGSFVPIIKGCPFPEELAKVFESMLLKPGQVLNSLINMDTGFLWPTQKSKEENFKIWQQYLGGAITLDQAMASVKKVQEEAAEDLISEFNWDLSEYGVE
jgi:ABC-type glycerol-3-phosphate transport system substrate-binding protein